jgi:hypothetical protein
MAETHTCKQKEKMYRHVRNRRRERRHEVSRVKGFAQHEPPKLAVYQDAILATLGQERVPKPNFDRKANLDRKAPFASRKFVRSLTIRDPKRYAYTALCIRLVLIAHDPKRCTKGRTMHESRYC